MGKLVIPPCYKYIAQSLMTPEDRYQFSRQLFERLKLSGADPDESMMLYSSVGMPPSVGHPCSYNGVTLNPQDYYEHIMGLTDISCVSCPQYYKSCLKPNNQNNVCQLCDLSKSCKITNYAVECSIFKFVISDRKNLVKFEELGVKGAFKYVFDIVAELPNAEPAIVPLLDIAYSVVCSQPDAVYSHDDISERLKSLMGEISFSASKIPSVQSVILGNHKALPVAWELVMSDILSATDMNFDEVCSEVSKIDLSSSKRKRANKKKKPIVEENPLFEYLDNVGKEPVTAPEPPKEEVSEQSEPVSDAESSEMSEPSEEQEPDNSFITIEMPDDDELPFGAVEVVPEGGDIEPPDLPQEVLDESAEEYSDSDIVNEGDEYSDAEAAASDPSWYADPDEETQTVDDNPSGIVESQEQTMDTEPQPEVAETAEPTVPAVPEQEPKVLKYRVPPIDESDLIFNIVVNKKTFKNYANSYKSKESEVFTALQKSKRLPLEVIHDENGAAYLFMFIRAMGQFVYCPIEQRMPNSIIAILLSKSVVKICYQPYFLYSLLRIYDIRVCGVYSICTVDSLLHPEAQIAYYNDFFGVYAGDFPNITPVDTGFQEFDSLILNMQKYILIHARQTRSPFDKLEYVKRHSRDEVLGSSFLRIINLKTNDYLFSLEPSGKIVYNQNFEQQARHDGFFVTYSVGAEDIGELALNDLYLDALYELSNKGRFRKYNIQLVTMTRTAMVLFIGESEYELITTAIQKFFNRYALTHRMEKFELNVAHQRIYCKTQKGAKQGQIPRTYEQAMDLLITTNDTVSVNETHVVKRGKAKRKAQTQSFKPT